MISRRSFLGGAAATVVAAGCVPPRLHAQPIVDPTASDRGPPHLRSMAGLAARRGLMLGYPVNMADPPEAFFRWRKELARVGLDRFPFNNVGSPFEHGHFPFHSHGLEHEVAVRFGAIYRFPPDDAWGFLTNSGTDSNMHGMYMGRTVLEHRTGRPPRAYFTAEAHYSIQILADLLGLDWVPVGTLEDGSMDAADLARLLDDRPDEPALVVATIGTTFRGAIDPVDEVRAATAGRPAYVHVDAALFGGYLPHTRFARELWQRDGATAAGRYDSIAVSCHKFFGFVSPAGIYITTRALFDEFHRAFGEVHDPSYILQVPGTITCSRDAVKPAEFLFYASESDQPRQREDAVRTLRNTTYLIDQMRSRFPELDPVRFDDRSNTVWFRRPSGRIVEKYVLATMDAERDGEVAPHAHVVVMPHATRAILDRFLDDLDRDR